MAMPKAFDICLWLHLSMATYGYIWLHMATYGYIWLWLHVAMATCGYGYMLLLLLLLQIVFSTLNKVTLSIKIENICSVQDDLF